MSKVRSINFDHRKNLLVEHKGSKKANGPGEDEERGGDYRHVSQVDTNGTEPCVLQRKRPVQHCIHKYIKARSTRDQKAPPLPFIVLFAKLEIGHDNTDLS